MNKQLKSNTENSSESNNEQENYDDLLDRKFLLMKGQIIFDTIKNQHYRLLYIPKQNSQSEKNVNTISDSSDSNKGYWISTDSKSNVPVEFKISEVLHGLQVSRYVTSSDNFTVILPAQISHAAQDKMEKAYAIIDALVKNEPDIYEQSKRKILIKQIHENSEITVKTIYKYLGLYWRGGMQKEALLPKFFKIGSGRKENFEQKKRLGRPSKYHGKNGKILTEDDFQNFRNYIKTLYLSTKKPKLREVYDNMLSHCYSKRRFDGDTMPTPLPPEEKPSYMQFYYWYRKNRDSVEEAKGRLGESKFNLTCRGTTGRSETDVLGPGMVYQIDATIADYYLVQSKNRKAIVGRPVMYFIRDVKTRMITGMYVSLENASYNGALMALKNCADDKVAFCRRYGIEIKPEEWPCHHMPNILIGDNGEMANYGIESVILKLGIAVQNTPPYRGDLKGIIESVFNTLNMHIHYLIPGHVDKDANERGAIDRKKEACIDLTTFTRLLIRCVLYYNNKCYIEKYNKTPDMRLRQIKPIPLELWNYGIQYESGALRCLTRDQINRILLPRGEATITESGIVFNGLYYTCSDAESNLWFAKARISGRSKISIVYDPTCLTVIYIYREKDSLIECTLLSKSSVYAGASEEDMKRYHEDDKQEEASYAQEQERAKTNLILEIEKEVKRCKKDSSHAVYNEVSAKLKKTYIRENRAREKDELSGKAQAMREQKLHGNNDNIDQILNTSSIDKSTADVLNDNIINYLKEAGLLMEDE